MNFPTPLVPDDAARMLQSYSTESEFIAFTEVNIRKIYEDRDILNFTVTRRWRGSRGLFDYPVVNYKGTLTAREDGTGAQVEGRVSLEVMAYVIMVIAVIVLIAALADQRNAIIWWLVLLILGAMAALEGYVYSRIMTALRQGSR